MGVTHPLLPEWVIRKIAEFNSTRRVRRVGRRGRCGETRGGRKGKVTRSGPSKSQRSERPGNGRPGRGPLTREQLEHAVQYYAVSYSVFPPGLLADEVHRCRALITGMLGHTQPDAARVDLRRMAGWLSALLGNLTFHLSDYPAAWIHLGTAARLGVDVSDDHLICWSLGAQSMVARYQHRYADALDLARQGLEHTTTPLTRAQLLTWAELPALAPLGAAHRSDPELVLAAARRELDTDPDGEQPGRFGFDVAELELHVAELISRSATPPARPPTRSHRSSTPR